MWWTEKWLDKDGAPKEDTYHPHPYAPLCAPCNYDKDTSKLPFPSPPACPCKPRDLCNAAKEGEHCTIVFFSRSCFSRSCATLYIDCQQPSEIQHSLHAGILR